MAKILFVDDEEYLNRERKNALEQAGHEVAFETSVNDAIARLRGDERFDVLIQDVMMPSPDGMEQQTADGRDTGLWVLREVRDILVRRNTAVLVLTHRNFQYVQQSVTSIDLPTGLVEVSSKIETPLFVLTNTIGKLLSSRSRLRDGTEGVAQNPIRVRAANDRKRDNTWVEYNNSDTAVIFIHGIMSSSESCWRNAGNGAYWPELVLNDRDFGRPSVYLAGYATGLFAGEFEVYDAAESVMSHLKASVNGRRPMEKDKILFVCHSQGGIVVRQLLTSYSDLFSEKAVGVVLCGSPSLGSGWARLAAPFAHILRFQQAIGLKRENSALMNLDREFLRLIERRKIKRLTGTCLVETRGFMGLPKIVQNSSSTRYFTSWKKVPKSNHNEIVKPYGIDHLSHIYLREFASENEFI